MCVCFRVHAEREVGNRRWEVYLGKEWSRERERERREGLQETRGQPTRGGCGLGCLCTFSLLLFGLQRKGLPGGMLSEPRSVTWQSYPFLGAPYGFNHQKD